MVIYETCPECGGRGTIGGGSCDPERPCPACHPKGSR